MQKIHDMHRQMCVRKSMHNDKINCNYNSRATSHNTIGTITKFNLYSLILWPISYNIFGVTQYFEKPTCNIIIRGVKYVAFDLTWITKIA